MLTTECTDFRVAFSPQDRASAASDHRAQCAACDAYARRLEDAAAEPAKPFSSSLKARLAAIPQLALGCDDIDTLYAVTRQRALGARPGAARPSAVRPNAVRPNAARPNDTSAHAHLLACRRCRDLYGCLHDAMVEGRQALPAKLFERLRQISRNPPPKLPIWVLDGRYATAICYLLTAVLVLLASDASARFQVTPEVVSARASTWLDDRLDDSSLWIGGVGEQLQQSFDSSRVWLVEHRDKIRQTTDDRAARLEDRFRSLNLDPRRWLDGETSPDPQPTEGDSDDREN